LNHLTSGAEYGAAALLLFFLPATPLLFMGQEWAATTPFCYFTDHEGALGDAIAAGRRSEFAHFEHFAANPRQIPDPQAEATFLRSKLHWSERHTEPHASVLRLYRLLVGLRRSDEVLKSAPARNLNVTTRHQVLRLERWLGDRRRWLFVNFGMDVADLSVTQDDKRILAQSRPHALEGSRLSGHSAVILGTK